MRSMRLSNDLNGVSNPFDIAYDHGSGALDRRHIFNVNYIYELPFFAKGGNASRRWSWEAGRSPG